MPNTNLLTLAVTVFIAVTLIVLGDTAGKLLTSQGVSPSIVSWTRFVIAAIILLPLSGLKLSELKHFKDWRIIMRSALIALSVLAVVTAAKTEPIANVFGAFFIGPIISYVMAVLWLGETPSKWRGILLLIGFAGVLLVVKPGVDLTLGMLIALSAGLFHGFYLVTTRWLTGTFRPRLLMISQLFIGAALLTPLGVSATIPTLDLTTILLILGSALGSGIGNYMLVVASRDAEASLVAPLVYSQLISATLIGIIIFGDWPDTYTLLGLIIIITSGLGSLRLAGK